jgi:hypothetical protein
LQSIGAAAAHPRQLEVGAVCSELLRESIGGRVSRIRARSAEPRGVEDCGLGGSETPKRSDDTLPHGSRSRGESVFGATLRPVCSGSRRAVAMIVKLDDARQLNQIDRTVGTGG